MLCRVLHALFIKTSTLDQQKDMHVCVTHACPDDKQLNEILLLIINSADKYEPLIFLILG